jgi:pyruvate formate-lyase activating enzyme-like uncharacterized protein
MKALINFQQKLVAQNRKEYGVLYDQLKKPSYYGAIEADEKRAQLITETDGKAGYLFNGTKPFAHVVSPGCRLCGEGHWSCLFINNRCNCNCFYCPAPQVDTAIPETQGLTFENPENYIAYIKKMGFKGVALSGGEPLLTFDKTIDFLTKIKKEFGSSVYLWMYTNGTLLDEEKATKLAETGLDEIRFDLTATDYNTKKLKLALGKIPNVTVEIPAIPDEIEQLKSMVVELDSLGVNYLNLHQIRLTPYNLKNLLSRNYTFLHGHRVTVLESELAALEIISFVFKQGLKLPVNYCSFHYKNHYQKAAFRKKAAQFVLHGQQEINGNGFIRTLSLHGISIPIESLKNQLLQIAPHGEGWLVSEENDQIFLTKNLLFKMQLAGEPVFVDYLTAVTSKSPLPEGVDVKLTDTKSIYFAKEPGCAQIRIETEEREDFFEILQGKMVKSALESEELFEVSLKELPATGFVEYF